MKCVIFAIFIMIAMAMAAPQRDNAVSCSPLYSACRQYSDCCRYLECPYYLGKCTAKGGLHVPGQDTRPLGPGPYPPNIPESNA